MDIAAGQGQTNPRGQSVFINKIMMSIQSFATSFLPLNGIVTVFFPFKPIGDQI